jgi:hypothetical protein
MKKINLQIRTDDLKFPTPEDKNTVFSNHIQAGFQMHIQQTKGSNLADFRKMNRILDKLEKAEEKKAEYLELEDADFEFLHQVYTTVKWQGGGIKVITRIGDRVEEAKTKATQP